LPGVGGKANQHLLLNLGHVDLEAGADFVDRLQHQLAISAGEGQFHRLAQEHKFFGRILLRLFTELQQLAGNL